MEERQTQIREGAGLEESKLNVEFIEWLRKWSTPILGVVAVVALGFVIANRIERGRQAAVDKAFEEFETAARSASPNPDTLKAVASENSGIRSVPVLAELEAADLYLRSARLGLRLGAKPDDKGEFPATEVLSAEEREANLASADALYKKTLDAIGADPKKAVLALGAAFGTAAVAEARGKLDDARQAYERAERIATNAGLHGQAEVAKKRIDALPTLAEAPRLLASADLPKPPPPPTPTPDPNAPIPPPVTPPGAVYQPTPTPGAEAPKPDAPTGEPQPAPTQPASPPTQPAPSDPKPADPAPAPANPK